MVYFKRFFNCLFRIKEEENLFLTQEEFDILNNQRIAVKVVSGGYVILQILKYQQQFFKNERVFSLDKNYTYIKSENRFKSRKEVVEKLKMITLPRELPTHGRADGLSFKGRNSN